MRPHSRSEEHIGEWKLTLWADTPEELFVEAARVVSREAGRSSVRRPPAAEADWEPVTLSARDAETLLVDWLNELLGRSEISRRAYREFRGLRLSDGRIEAEIRGTPVPEWRSSLKAATYHGLQLVREGHRWKAVVLFDV